MAIGAVKEHDFGIALQFTNFRPVAPVRPDRRIACPEPLQVRCPPQEVVRVVTSSV